MCDFSGNIVPEIIKKRPVVVITPHHIQRAGLSMVVPLSSTPSDRCDPYVVELSQNYGSYDFKRQFAKCDLACSVSWKRLDRFKLGYRRYASFHMTNSDFEAVIAGVAYAFGMKTHSS